jgi:hypothetical protein
MQLQGCQTWTQLSLVEAKSHKVFGESQLHVAKSPEQPANPGDCATISCWRF